jgi:hypothetical protein
MNMGSGAKGLLMANVRLAGLYAAVIVVLMFRRIPALLEKKNR